MVVGSSGYGKSTILKTLIRQNLVRGEGVAVLDPQHDLAAWTAVRVPRRRANHVVYISPQQLVRTGRAVPINPLEPYGGAPGIAAADFAATLLRAFGVRGVRMEQLLTQAATSMMAARRGGLGALRRIILDKSERDAVLADVRIDDNLDFWRNVFPATAKSSVPAVDNKLTPITSNPAVGPFFEGDTGFDMARLVAGSGVLIFDGAGCNNDTERILFVTFLLDMVTAAAAKLAQSRPQGTPPPPFYLYVDEIQMLESGRLKEMLQTVRKWGIRMTLATQQLESIPEGRAAAMIGNCDLYIASRCTPATARLLSPKMGLDPDVLTRVPKFHMCYHMGAPSGDMHGSMVRIRDADRGPVSWRSLEEVADRSLLNYGADADMSRYGNQPGDGCGMGPLEYAVLCVMYHNPGGLSVDEICDCAARFGAPRRDAARIVSHRVRAGLVGAASLGGRTAYTLRGAALEKHFDTAALGRRAGGARHVGTILRLHDLYSRLGWFTRMDVGAGSGPMPDLEVCEPATGPDGGPDPARWGRRVAVEVETGPGRHPNRPGKPGQVYRNWLKSRGRMDVWFVVYAEGDARIASDQLAEMGVGPDEYAVTVWPEGDAASGGAVPLPPGFGPAEPLPRCAPRGSATSGGAPAATADAGVAR